MITRLAPSLTTRASRSPIEASQTACVLRPALEEVPNAISEQDADLDTYVTQKALDGLFLMIAEQEKSIRKDPIGTGSSLLKKVFGALK